ncbi:GntR family transcriptional regulator [Streptomyces sp. AV19]|uniref:GntR family transcriptional regulator n=1 Tax=Streptomyces sp. AV19 TaxID=2793068 RepID=UPI0018FE3CC0|nr:GntR family transcriptional regulator [Streptomyces sp. AV19]MBH1938628.1 GntR family transcriptional regulator [Streptomyces sp. AV19]MDG4535340.1 GntR family transcriptional regulator [Streptomyces sp. AV19]
MLVTIDHSSPIGLAEQIAASVRRSMAEGKLRKGDRLPSARALARTLDINMHTVLRGYQILKEDQLIDLRPGRGAVVAAVAANQIMVVDACLHFIQAAQKAGMTSHEILSLVAEHVGPGRGASN